MQVYTGDTESVYKTLNILEFAIMLENIAPFLIGLVVGWMIFYFIRRYKKFTPTMLVASVASILGGARIFSLVSICGHSGSLNLHPWRFLEVLLVSFYNLTHFTCRNFLQ
ncbi:hypothetical protein [uncultured Odoribacter sp.]|uniref:hypothetical protein n=1 Tax=uncultured Odoribacter sp. TaxID=876416 RepID=UPI00262DC01F|nr:hypothetical protein [uncultured Odoribacter sp.]